MMGRVLNGAIALTIGTAMFCGGAPGANAQNNEGAGEIEPPVAAGTLDDGAELLAQAGISLDAAIAAAQSAASGALGEVDLEYLGDRLVFNVDVGDQDVKVDAGSGAVLFVDMDD